MAKKIIAFSAITPTGEPLKKLDFVKTESGIEAELTLFSSDYNRNKAYFDVAKLMRKVNSLNSIQFNFNHNLQLTGGKYLGNLTRLTELTCEVVDAVIYIRGKMVSTDPLVLEQKDNITAPSIEILVDEKDVIANENGEYYIDVDWVGVALLLGVVQGSGNASLDSVRTFSADLSEELTHTIMTEEQVKAFMATALEEQETKLKKEFAEIVGQSQSASESVYEWTDEDGNKYRCTSKEVWQSVTELLETGTMSEGSLLTAMKAKKLEVKKFDAEEVENPEPETELEEAPAEESEEELKVIENQISKAEELANKMKNFRTEEEVENRDDVSKTAETKDFKTSLNEAITQLNPHI